ncbi:uncharacterized protein LOC128956511 [Oppia nitens]|uniref:uncharacterized protein LOC128956511 n=1 Tax=Oppia nitens TaxID=1686743 RepID=UPI0023DBB107|nr:uncharacterized protein LOC128956511 [Oppia nitens]
MSTERISFTLISMDSKMYAIGGYNDNDLNSVETYDTQTNQWKSIQSMNIIRRQHGASVIQNSIYVCGGYNNKYIKSCESYSPNTDEWSFVTPMTTDRRGLALVANNGFIYAIGGYNGFEYLNTMERLDTTKQQWQPMANMKYTRFNFGSALFMDKIYVCGGYDISDGKSCESYDPKTNQWTPIASMLIERFEFSLIEFNDKLYALGGYTKDFKQTDTVEIYDHKSNQWYFTTSLPKKLQDFGQTIDDLSDSFIYICGGYDGSSQLSQCYKYNKQTAIWETIQYMSTPRNIFSLISYDSKLYAIGGLNDKYEYLNSVEKYDTQTNQWKSIVSMNILRGQHATSVIQNTIYVCGGQNDKYIKSCESYSLNTDEWYFITPMTTERYGLALVAHNGFFYAIGGSNGKEIFNTMERYDTTTQQWQPMANMKSTRSNFGSASFMDKIYVCGGYVNSDTKSCETYDPKLNQWTPIASMQLDRVHFNLIAFNNKLYALGGLTKDIGQPNTVEIYDHKSNEWFYTTLLPKKLSGFGNCFDSTSTIAINNQTITDDLLDNSFIYICGGLDGTTYLSQCYKYNKQTGIWETIQSLTTKRDFFSLISYDSKLYAIGGYNGKTLNSIETYDTLTNKWQSIAPMNIIRYGHDATVIQNTIYVCGGQNGNVFKSCEYYSLTTNEWHFAQPMDTDRRNLELVANDGFIYAIGGHNGKEYLNTMERYDIKTQQWQPMGNMRYARAYFGSALFMGKLYVCGGLGNNDQKSCESYDPKANQWTPIASMLLDRRYFKLIAFNQKLYALGGQGKDGKPTETVEVYDYKSNQWYYTTSLPKKVYNFGATV